jgi:uncharacterized membrane protein YqhA
MSWMSIWGTDGLMVTNGLIMTRFGREECVVSKLKEEKNLRTEAFEGLNVEFLEL